jgi:hypothetical protein
MIRAAIDGRAHELDDVFGFAREGADLRVSAGGETH